MSRCHPFRVNGRQLLIVLTGIGLFLAGAFVGLTPVSSPTTGNGPANAVPFLDPERAFQHDPAQVLVAVSLLLLGLAVSVAGPYLLPERSGSVGR